MGAVAGDAGLLVESAGCAADVSRLAAGFFPWVGVAAGRLAPVSVAGDFGAAAGTAGDDFAVVSAAGAVAESRCAAVSVTRVAAES